MTQSSNWKAAIISGLKPKQPVATSELLHSIAVGAAAGVSAAWIMNQIQALMSNFSERDEAKSDEEEESKPTTVKIADMVSRAVSGEPVTQQNQSAAGAAVHYSFGALLGGLYGAIGAVAPRVKAGFGTAYGASVALLADEAMVPALDLSPPPQKIPASTHAYSIFSHLVFGIALEGTRRALESALSYRMGDKPKTGAQPGPPSPKKRTHPE